MKRLISLLLSDSGSDICPDLGEQTLQEIFPVSLHMLNNHKRLRLAHSEISTAHCPH